MSQQNSESKKVIDNFDYEDLAYCCFIDDDDSTIIVKELPGGYVDVSFGPNEETTIRMTIAEATYLRAMLGAVLNHTSDVIQYEVV